MAKTGRPSALDKIDKDKLKELYLDGKTDAEIAEVFGITRKTVCNWRKKNPEFVLALNDEWKKVADHRVERSLYERACGYTHPETKAQWVQDKEGGRWEYAEMLKHYPPDPTSMIFWLKNRQPALWRDKQEHEHTGRDGGPIEQKWTGFPGQPMTMAEWERQAKEADASPTFNQKDRPGTRKVGEKD